MDHNPSAFLAHQVSHPYLVYGTSYSERSPKVKAQHLLCHALNQAGCEAYIMSGKTSPLLRTPSIHVMRRTNFRIAGRLLVVIYPETVTGNPLEEPMVIRWLQDKPGAVVDNWTGSYSRSDMVFCEDEAFLIDGLAGTRLQIPVPGADQAAGQTFEAELRRFIEMTQRRANQLIAIARQM